MVGNPIRIGILALQGCVLPHESHFRALGVTVKLIRFAEDCVDIDGYVLPGGESTTMLRLIHSHSLDAKLRQEWTQKPVWGVCAGAILMGTRVTDPDQESYGLIDCHMMRNAYGSQLMSHYGVIEGYEVAFIRAPKIVSWGEGVEVLAMHHDSPCWIRRGRLMATTFHAELNLNTPSPMHQYFVQLCIADPL